MWISRRIEDTIKAIAQQRPALILTGCRQTGKTSLLLKTFPGFSYVSLDVPLISEQAEESGDQFLENHPFPLIIDEVQYAPRLLRYLKQSIDRNRDLNNMYLLTGSQKFSLMQGITESLAGRVAVLTCHSLSALELEQWSNKTAEGNQLIEWMYTGSYPELHAKSLDPERFYSDYLSTYIERDVRQIIQIKSLRDFDRFIRLVASRTGQLLSYSSMASDIGVSPNTIKSWISALEASNIIYLLEPYYNNIGKRLVKAPKLYFLDTGLACYLTGLRSPAELRQSSLIGAVFETFVLGQIIRHYANSGKTPSVYYYRDHYGHEVDFVIPVGERLKLYECKWSEIPSHKVKGFDEITRLIGADNILSKSIITPARGQRHIAEKDLIIEDAIDLKSLI